MLKLLAVAVAVQVTICFCCLSFGQTVTDGPYKTDPASVKKDGVPEGKLILGEFDDSKIFPGTKRKYGLYIPNQYRPSRPACLMVFQDGLKFTRPKGVWKVPTVFDNLIHTGEMPVTIGLFVEPGIVPAANENALPRYNRSLEYDAIDTRYADFLIQELIPRVEKDYRISRIPDDRAICGSSSGGIAAFNAAWQRPSAFRRVLTTVGTYIGLRGANQMPTLVRKSEPKPLRIFLQDGNQDLNIYCGDWWIANQDMLSALQFSGYEVNHIWGTGGHNGKHGSAILPDALRWLWKDWPHPVSTHPGKSRSRVNEILVPGQDWELVSQDHKFLTTVAADQSGNIYFSDRVKGHLYRLDAEGNESLFWKLSKEDASRPGVKIGGIAVGAGGQIYLTLPSQRSVIEISSKGKLTQTIATDVNPNGIVAASDGTIYFTDSKSRAVWMKQADSPAKVAGKGFAGLTGITLSTDQTMVMVSDFSGRYVWSSQRAADNTLQHVQPYFHIHSPPADVDPRPRSEGMCVSKEGWLLVATRLGVQVCDQTGRVNFIIASPNNGRYPTGICFCGPDKNTVYAVCGGRMFKRSLKLAGAAPWATPVKPKKPKL